MKTLTLRPPCMLTAIALSCNQAWAQDPPPTPPDAAAVQTVEVTGKALAVQKAIAAKREQLIVSDGISSDEIGSIPDFGLGEALERVPGVSMVPNNGRGEAQFMTLRGMNPDYNTVTIDGIALPGTETTRRTVSLDVIPSSLARQVNVYKTFTPEMDGNAVGGITNLVTRSARARTGLHASGRADYTSWDKPKLRHRSPSGQFEGTVSNTWGDQNQFGALLSAGYYRKVSTSLSTAIDSYSYYRQAGSQTNAARLPQTASPDDALAMPDRLRWLSYDNVRERRNLFSRFDYDNGLRLHVTGGIFQHLNDEDRRAQWLQNTTGAGSRIEVASGTDGSVASGQSQTDYAKFDQKRELRYAEIGGDYAPAPAQLLDFALNGAHGAYRQTARLYTFASANNARLSYHYHYLPGGVPVFTPDNAAFLADPANYNQTENTSQLEASDNRARTVRLNYAWNLGEDSRGWGYKAGGQRRALTQDYDFDELKYVPATGVAIPLAAVGASTQAIVPYNSNGRAMLLVDPLAAQRYFDAHGGQYAPAGTNVQNSTQKDFSIDEDVAAAYAMAVYRAATWSTVFGARVERTRMDVATFVPTPGNQTRVYARSTTGRHYTNVLPSAGVNYDLAPDFKLRAAASTSLGRPTYAALGQNSSGVSGTTITQTLANPGLQARTSRNLDLSAEWYPTPQSMIAAGLFHKDIHKEIASLTSTQSVTIDGTVYQNNVTTQRNVGDASVTGLELGLAATRFKGLPAPWNNVGASFNYTRLLMNPSNVTMTDGSPRTMPSLMESPRSICNVSLLWGSGPLSAQLSYNWSGKTLITLSTTNPAQDIYYDAAGYVDMQLRYSASKKLAFVVQSKNLGNTRRVRVTGLAQQLLNQEIENGRALYAGLTFAY